METQSFNYLNVLTNTFLYLDVRQIIIYLRVASDYDPKSPPIETTKGDKCRH